MKILHLCTYDVGGAANAALRLHQGLRARGHDSIFLSKQNTRPGEGKIGATAGCNFLSRNSARLEFHLSRLFHPFIRPVLTSDFMNGCAAADVNRIRPDVLNLHWVDHGLISPNQFPSFSKSKIPMVWTLHDLAPLSGGVGYREPFGLPPDPKGPLIIPGVRSKISAGILDRRVKGLETARIQAVSPSKWLAHEASRSPVFKNRTITVIPNGVDTDLFKPIAGEVARNRFGLQQERKIILFAADTFTEPRKGIQHLINALSLLQLPSTGSGSPLLLAFGNSEPLNENEGPIAVKALGRLSDPADLVAAYNSADVFACPSREDNLPNTVLESLSCGTPVVGFEVGGVPDFVITGKSGYIAPRYDEGAFAEGMANILSADVEASQRMKEACRSTATTFLTLDKQAAAYEEIYSTLLRSKI